MHPKRKLFLQRCGPQTKEFEVNGDTQNLSRSSMTNTKGQTQLRKKLRRYDPFFPSTYTIEEKNTKWCSNKKHKTM
jgi:hypothetical protein